MAFDLSSRRAHLVVATIAVVALSAVNNGPLFWRGEAPGDLIDGRFNLYVLEHIYRWLTGQESSLVSPAIFYPFRDVLFFSDAHAGSALVYAAFRALGLSEYHAYNSWFLVGYVSTFVAAYYAIARFGGDALTAALGAAIFAFSLPSVAQFGHSQLVYRCGAPMALLQLWLGVRDGSARSFVLAFIWLCFQFLLSIYLGMFLFLVMAAFAVAGAGGRARREAAARMARRARRGVAANVALTAAVRRRFRRQRGRRHPHRRRDAGDVRRLRPYGARIRISTPVERNRQHVAAAGQLSADGAVAVLGAFVVDARDRGSDAVGAQPVHRVRRAGILCRRSARSPKTPTPWRIVACSKNDILKMPRRPSAGIHIQRRRFQFDRAKSLGAKRFPFSTTRTRYPFSANRRAETLPPKPTIESSRLMIGLSGRPGLRNRAEFLLL